MPVLKNGSHELQSAQSASAASAASALRWGVPPWVRNYKRLWNDTFRLGKICCCVFFILFHVCTLSWLFWESLRFHVLWSIFYIMMDESSFHQCRSSKFHIYMSRPTWAFFCSRTVLKIAGFYRFPGTLSHWIPSFTEIFRERWFPSDSDDDFGSDFFFILKFWHVLTISSKLGYFQMVPWSEIGPPKKGPDVMDSRDLNRNPFSLVIFGDLFGWYPAW